MEALKEYTVEVHREKEGGFSGKCLDLPGVNSQGETLEELKKNMTEAIQLVLEYLEDKKRDLKAKNNILTVEVPGCC